MAIKYGLPYQGSKNKLAKRIVALLPEADHLYDLFAGGCAVSHLALYSNKWKYVHFSDVNDSVLLFKDCLDGNIPDGSEWISREDFFKRKDADPYVRIIWSFGNNQKDYLYSREIEPYKQLVHEMIYSKSPNERRLKFRQVCRWIFQSNNGLLPDEGKIQSSEGHERLKACAFLDKIRKCEHQERNNILRSIATERISSQYSATIADYRNIEILPNSVIYCDIPYAGAKEYVGENFNHEEFYDWCLNQKSLCFISEYWMPEDRFICIAEFERTSTYSSTNNNLKVLEKIYIPIHQIGQYNNYLNQKSNDNHNHLCNHHNCIKHFVFVFV